MKHGRQKLEEQAKKYLQEQKMRGDRLFEKWQRTDIGYGLDKLYETNSHKARNVATWIQNEENHLKQLNETIISQNFSTTPENVLKIVRIGTANSHRGDFATEVALQTTDDRLFFIDMTYESAVTGSDASAGEKIYEKAYPYFAGQTAYQTESGDGGTSYTISFDNAPVYPHKIHVLLDGELVGYDDGNNGITAVGSALTAASCSVTYGDSAAITLVFADAVEASSTIKLIYEWDSEDSDLYTRYPKVSLSVNKKRFDATLQPLGYTYSTMTEILLGSTGLGDAEEMLLGAVGDEHAKAKDYRAIALLKAVAKTNTQYQFDAAFATEGEVSAQSHAQSLLTTISDIGGDIYDDIKRGQVNKAVAGSRATTYLSRHDRWVPNPSANMTGVYMAGTLDGIEVYTCPADDALVSNNEVLLMYKNPNEGLDVGVAFGVLTEVTAALAYPQFYIDGNVGVVEDSLVINRDFCRLLTINNLPSYTASS